MEVRVVHCDRSPSVCPDKDFVHVRTTVDPENDTVTLATIQRVVEKAAMEDPAQPRRRVKTLIMKMPMAVDAALALARRYAERKKIPVIYAHAEQETAG